MVAQKCPPRMTGERNGQAILTEADVVAIRRRVSAGETQREMARAYGVSHTAIGLIVRRKTWTLLTDPTPLAPPVGRRGSRNRGERHARAILTEAAVVAIIARLAAGEFPSDIARDYDVAASVIYPIRAGRTWRHVPRPEPWPPPHARAGEAAGRRPNFDLALLPEAACARCGSAFRQRGIVHLYCSRTCVKAAWREHRPGREMTCVECGTTFHRAGETRRFCSANCQRGHRSRERAAARDVAQLAAARRARIAATTQTATPPVRTMRPATREQDIRSRLAQGESYRTISEATGADYLEIARINLDRKWRGA